MQPATTPEDIPRNFADAWNRRSAHELAGLFADDADFVNVVGLWWHNRADIERAHAYGLATFFRKSNLAARRIAVRYLGENAATIHVRWKLSGQRDQDDQVLDDRSTVMVFVAEKRQGAWIAVAAQNTDVIAGAETFRAKDGSHEAVDYRK
jgi:uncharacterized protein (TIGR02246 family)